jgi:hypothetical protein
VLAASTDEQDREYRRCRRRDKSDEEHATARERSRSASRVTLDRRPLHGILDCR